MANVECEIIYFELPSGEIPVKVFIDNLEVRARNKILRILGNIEEFGLLSAIPHTKKLTGTPLWEIRVLGRDSVRILFISVLKNRIVLLHGFIKKTQKTPVGEIETALKRYSSLDF